MIRFSHKSASLTVDGRPPTREVAIAPSPRIAPRHRITLPQGTFNRKVSEIALLLMLASVLLPSAYYSYHLKDPTPSQLLVAICIGVFSSVVFLRILDAVSIMKFRAEWIVKSVYGAAIVSILGTSAGVYKDAFSESKYPYEGRWDLQIVDDTKKENIIDNTVVLVYSIQSETYWGYSDYRQSSAESSSPKVVWARIYDFDPQGGHILITAYSYDGSKATFDARVEKQRTGKLFVGHDHNTIFRLTRPN